MDIKGTYNQLWLIDFCPAEETLYAIDHYSWMYSVLATEIDMKMNTLGDWFWNFEIQMRKVEQMA